MRLLLALLLALLLDGGAARQGSRAMFAGKAF